MTDNDIVKAFEWCTGGTSQPCRECPLENEAFCKDKIEEGILALINRQKADIERLIGDVTTYKIRWAKAEASKETAKAEAIKEFAERLLELKIKPEFPWDDFYVTEYAIKDLVKEMQD